MERFLVCKACGQTFAEFQKGGLLGCPACYVAFESELGRLFKRLHGACRHSVDSPAIAGQSLSDLEGQLKDAVAREDYETAGALRDRIRALKTQGMQQP